MPAYTFFTIPFELVPGDPPYKVWFASWSRVKPERKANTPQPLVVGVTRGELPSGGTLLGTGLKDQPELEQPPLPPSPTAVTLSDYRESVNTWLNSSKDTQPCVCFTIPCAQVSTPCSYTAWFATWSEQRPEVAAGTHPPLVIGLSTTGLPEGATELASGSGGKDPPPPPPDPTELGTSLAAHVSWMIEELTVRWA